MIKNIIIDENGTGKAFTTNMLKTPLQGGGLCNWVPEGETKLIAKHVTKNGVYAASDDGAYGYSSIDVNVIAVNGITGTGSDGKQHTITSDPTTGELIDNVAPVSIAVTVKPYTGPYMPGAYIGFDGIVVHAYDSTGADMGIIPFSELIFPVTVAVYDPTVEPSPEYDVSGLGLNAPLYLSNLSVGDIIDQRTAPRTVVHNVTGDIKVLLLMYSDTYVYVMASLLPGSSYDVGREGWTPSTAYLIHTVDIDGTTVYTSGTTGGSAYYYTEWANNWELSAQQPSEYSPQYIIALALAKGTPLGTNMDVPVQWARPGDGVILSTSFGVIVEPGPSGTND